MQSRHTNLSIIFKIIIILLKHLTKVLQKFYLWYCGVSDYIISQTIQDKHKALELDSGKYCKPNHGSLYTHLFKEKFDAHDALEDVSAMR